MKKGLARLFSTTCKMESAATRVSQPKWHVPQQPGQESTPKLRVFNSLTRSKVDFTTLKPNRITWYSCGPTVYDASHMGHARNYVSTDINRRILQDYFGYNVFFVQNVTDIDDKIIVRARQGYLFEQFKKQLGDKVDDELIHKARDATELYSKDNVNGPATPEEFAQFVASLPEAEKTAKFKMHAGAIQSAHEAIKSGSAISVEEFLGKIKTVLLYCLDKREGDTVTEHRVFRELSSFWEHDYDKDMAALNVLPPSVTTRVSEYVPEIVSFVQKIVSNGFAYKTDDGSVYFDTVAFESSGHDYAKLQPWNKGQLDLIDEGEGSLSKSKGGKKSANDFALWKASKRGEPSWDSPWGQGRPGWHIECSVMASEILGQQMDIHSGGIDLAFPHHDNELAQSEAFHECNQWVNYFMHAGHLHIEGSKMSKSLKNFISIKEALRNNSARQLRLAFAMQQWNAQLDFRPALTEVKAFESALTNYFNKVRAYKREQTAKLDQGENVPKKAGLEDMALYDALYEAQQKVDAAFCDNLSTPVALSNLAELIQKCNTYLAKNPQHFKLEPLEEIARWVTKILRILGFRVNDDFGWASESTGAAGSVEDVAGPYVAVMSKFRDSVRSAAIAKAPYSEFLQTTDRVRNYDLLELGVSLDDRGNDQPALVKFVDGQEQAELIKQRDEKEQRDAEKAIKKAQAAKKAEEERLKKLEKAKLDPVEMFKSRPEYAEFDERGLPTKTASGEEVSKSARKKLEKEWTMQKKLHDLYREGKL